MNDEKAMRERALKLLERWAAAAERYWRDDPEDPSLGCYGSGYRTWGVQSNWNYAGALATLAAWGPPGDRERWRDRALAALRFALATHLTGHRADTRPLLSQENSLASLKWEGYQVVKLRLGDAGCVEGVNRGGEVNHQIEAA